LNPAIENGWEVSRSLVAIQSRIYSASPISFLSSRPLSIPISRISTIYIADPDFRGINEEFWSFCLQPNASQYLLSAGISLLLMQVGDADIEVMQVFGK
jgi:hypothetical protein